MLNREQKNLCSKVLDKKPILRLYIKNGQWEDFWKELLALDTEIFADGSEEFIPARLTNGTEVWFSTLFFMALQEASVQFSMDELPDALFEECSQINTIVLPNGMHNIGKHAFAESSVEKVIIPNTVNVIGAFAFSGCDNLKELTIPVSCDNLGRYMFEDTPIKKLRLPKHFEGFIYEQNIGGLGIKDFSVVEFY